MTDTLVERYARHILLPEIGGAGQAKLSRSSVLVVGAGGLGSPALAYLAAAGVGTIGIIDDDTVELSNLQRQIAHSDEQIGSWKTDSARVFIKRLNPAVKTVAYKERLTEKNGMQIIKSYDLVVDGSDNFKTRFIINDICYLASKVLVSAAILRFDAQISTYKAFLNSDSDKHPCYRCIFPKPPPANTIPTCAEAGVLGALCGVVGSLQATESIKELTGAGVSMSGTLLMIDGLNSEFRKVKIKPDPNCALCGQNPTITKSTYIGSK